VWRRRLFLKIIFKTMIATGAKQFRAGAMSATPDQLPNDIEEMKQLFLAQAANLEKLNGELEAAKAGLIAYALEIEKLKFQLARLRRQKFGSSSERIDREIGQLELRLEELEATKAQAEAKAEAAKPATTTAAAPAASEGATSPPAAAKPKKPRRKFPEHLPRTTVVHEPTQGCPTPGCDGALRKVSEEVTEILKYIPGRFEVERHVRPAMSCRKCESMVQAPMPALPIPRGEADASVLAHVAISKYCDHLPLYRQSAIYGRDGVDLDRSLLADWIGKSAWLLEPLAQKIGEHVMNGSVIHADDTPIKVLAPGHGKTKTGRFWVYLRDERPHGGSAPPAVVFYYSRDRAGERCREHLASFTGHLHADGYSGYYQLYHRDKNAKPGPITEVACWSHARRLFFDVHESNKSPIAKEALEKIGVLFDIERPIKGKPPDVRKQVRAELAKPRLDELAVWLDTQLQRIPNRSELAKAIRYARSRWVALTRYIEDGRLEISNNAVENKIRPAALGRKNYLFAGSDAGGSRAAIFYTIIGTCLANDVEPEGYLRKVLARIGEYPINRLSELLPWNFGGRKERSLAA
jgi:transposase